MELSPELRAMTLLPVAGATANNREYPGRVVEVHKRGKRRSRGDVEEEDRKESAARKQVLLRPDSSEPPDRSELPDRAPVRVEIIPLSLVEVYTAGGQMHSERLDFAARTVVSGDEVEAAREVARGLRAYVESHEFCFRSDALRASPHEAGSKMVPTLNAPGHSADQP